MFVKNTNINHRRTVLTLWIISRFCRRKKLDSRFWTMQQSRAKYSYSHSVYNLLSAAIHLYMIRPYIYFIYFLKLFIFFTTEFTFLPAELEHHFFLCCWGRCNLCKHFFLLFFHPLIQYMIIICTFFSWTNSENSP